MNNGEDSSIMVDLQVALRVFSPQRGVWKTSIADLRWENRADVAGFDVMTLWPGLTWWRSNQQLPLTWWLLPLGGSISKVPWWLNDALMTPCLSESNRFSPLFSSWKTKKFSQIWIVCPHIIFWLLGPVELSWEWSIYKKFSQSFLFPTGWGPQSIAFSCLISVAKNGRYNYSIHGAYFRFDKPTNIFGGPHPVRLEAGRLAARGPCALRQPRGSVAGGWKRYGGDNGRKKHRKIHGVDIWKGESWWWTSCRYSYYIYDWY